MKIIYSKAGSLFILAALFLVQGCASSGTHGSNREPAQGGGAEHLAGASTVEIEYLLGHNQHRFQAERSERGAQVTVYLERTIVEQASVDASKYDAFLAQVLTFAEKPQRVPAEETECRSPYIVTVKTSDKTYTSKGCRSSDNAGSLSRLVRDGEFLLYSKK